MEAHRWSPVGPMGLPHMSDKDIFFRDYCIPKGSYFLLAVWWFCHDPEVYENSELFDPERYLAPRNETDPKSIVFGFGRRSCLGRYFADLTVFLVVTQILAAFNVRKATTQQGQEIAAELHSIPGLFNHPKPFSYKIEARSRQKADLVSSIETEFPWTDSDFKELGTLLDRIHSACA